MNLGISSVGQNLNKHNRAQNETKNKAQHFGSVAKIICKTEEEAKSVAKWREIGVIFSNLLDKVFVRAKDKCVYIGTKVEDEKLTKALFKSTSNADNVIHLPNEQMTKYFDDIK